MKKKHGTSLVLVGAFIAMVSACSSGGKDCTTLCKEAQAGSCTAIKGDCANFCGAVDKVKGPSGCSSKHDAYLSCLNGKANVCDATCNSEENAAEQCVAAYCLTKPGDANCATVLAALQ